MTKHKSNLREIAESKTAISHEAHDKAEALHVDFLSKVKANPVPDGTYNAGRLVIPSVIALEHLKQELAVALAREQAAITEREAALALDAADLAEGLEDARARDLATLRLDLVELSAEADRLQAQANAARNRIHERVQAARRGESATAARRRAAGLPFVGSGFAPNASTPYLATIEEAMARGVPVHHATNIENLRNLIKRVAAALEEQRIEKDERAKRIAAEKAHREQQIADEQRRVHDAERARAAEAAAEARRRDELANAYLSRHAK